MSDTESDKFRELEIKHGMSQRFRLHCCHHNLLFVSVFYEQIRGTRFTVYKAQVFSKSTNFIANRLQQLDIARWAA